MAETDTLVLDPETATDAEETLDTSTEATETDGSGESTETGDERTYTEADLEERLKAERERVETELRERAEVQAKEAAAEQRRSVAQQNRQGRGLQQLQNLAAWAHKAGQQQGLNGNESSFDARQMNPQVLKSILDDFEGGVFQEQADAWGEAFSGYLAKTLPKYKPSRELATRAQRAAATWDPVGLVTAQFEMLREASREEVEAAVRAELDAERQKEAKTKGLKDTNEKRAATPHPTAVTESSAPAGRADLDEIIADVNRPLKERRAAFQRKHGYAPPF